MELPSQQKQAKSESVTTFLVQRTKTKEYFRQYAKRIEKQRKKIPTANAVGTFDAAEESYHSKTPSLLSILSA